MNVYVCVGCISITLFIFTYTFIGETKNRAAQTRFITKILYLIGSEFRKFIYYKHSKYYIKRKWKR